MSDLDDDAVIVSLPAEDDGVTIVGNVAPKKEAVADDPIADLKGQFATMTARATAAENAAQQTAHQLNEARRELQTTKAAVTDSQLDTVLSGIQAATAEADAAEKDYISAHEAGDGAAMARAQRKMATAEARVQRLNEAKGDLEEVKSAKPVPREETRPEPRHMPSDPVEQYIAKGGIDPNSKSARWLRAHPDCVTDDRKKARILAAHEIAKADGVPIESDEYFQRIEDGVAATKAEPKPEPRVEAKPDLGGKRPVSTAAGGGNTGGGMNGGGTQVKLSQREVLAATDGTHVYGYDDPKGKFKKDQVIGVQEFARRKAQMIKDGRYDRSFTES